MSVYFDEKVEQAILDYQDEKVDHKKRNLIYNSVIHPAFSKMAESIVKMRIRKIKKRCNKVEMDEFIQNTLGQMIICMEKYDRNSGYKAFSYFTRIAQNYAISGFVISNYDVVKKEYNYAAKTVHFEREDWITLEQIIPTKEPDEVIDAAGRLKERRKELVDIYKKLSTYNGKKTTIQIVIPILLDMIDNPNCIDVPPKTARQRQILGTGVIFKEIRKRSNYTLSEKEISQVLHKHLPNRLRKL